MLRMFRSALVALAVIGVGIGAIDQVSAAPEFKANTFKQGGQSSPALALLKNGNFVAVWRDDGPVTPSPSDLEGRITGRIFTAGGAKVGNEFVVSSSRYDSAYANLGSPAVAVLANGNFVVVWASDADDSSGWGNIHGRIMMPNGAPLAGEFKINRKLTGPQQFRAVAALADGGFVVSWASSPDGTSNVSYDIFAQRFNANGAKVGVQFRVHANLDDAEGDPAVAGFPAAGAAPEAAAPGGFVVVWGSIDGLGNPYSVFGQMFSAAGTKVGLKLTIAVNAQRPRVAVLDDGGFVVVWEALENFIYKVKAQRYFADGTKDGGAFYVKNVTTSQYTPDVAALSDGGFVIVFGDDAAQDSDIIARRYQADGMPAGLAFRASSSTYPSYRLNPSATGLRNGRFAVGWTGQDNGDPLTEDFDIFARVFN